MIRFCWSLLIKFGLLLLLVFASVTLPFCLAQAEGNPAGVSLEACMTGPQEGKPERENQFKSAMAEPAPLLISNSPKTATANDKASLESVAGGDGSKIGSEVGATLIPGAPTDLLPLASKAKANFDQGKFCQAEEQYQEILANNPNDLYSLSNLGVVLFRNGQLKAAESTLKKAIAIAPKDEFSHTTLGIVYCQEAKFDDALSELNKSIGINPKSATAHNYLGITASQKGWQEAAEKEMLEAIAVNPDYADAHFNLAVIYMHSQTPAKQLARHHYEKALALGAQSDPTLDKLLR